VWRENGQNLSGPKFILLGGSMKYQFRGVAMVAAVATAALLCGGCGRGGVHASAPEERDLTVGAVPVADAAALYIAQQRHLFAAQGLRVKIVPVVSGATAIAGQQAGKFDVVLGNYVSYILADAQHGAKFRVLAPGSTVSANQSMLLVPPGSPIQRVAQLKDVTIGVNALNNIGTLLVTSVLYDNGIYVKRDHVHFKAIPFPEMSHALLTHKIDAAWMVEPFVTYAELAGAQSIADTDSGATQDFPIGGYMVTQSWEQTHPRTAAAFRRALLAGQKIASVDPPAVWDGLKRFAGIPLSTADLIALPSYPLSVQADTLQRIAALMMTFGLLSHFYDTRRMLR
jgi:NitT/TauT family transport system substrate-binding protein